jgi:RHH-type transcriptional regulator, proline utilization regulon repressor / proline dehydrogenase / delta 1-pyrroline-5-carboxylate dehydrogenase
MSSPSQVVIDRAVALARELQERAATLQTPSERRQQAELTRMLDNAGDKATLIELTDQAFRSRTAARVAERFTHILDVQGVPRFFSPLERALLHGFQTFGGWLPGVAVPLVKEHMQQETANVILPAEPALLTAHLRARAGEGVRMNLNLLGEAVLGEEESRRRLELYLQALQMPEVEVVSIKISTIYSQISPLARDHTIDVLCDRLELLYREAAHMRFARKDGTETPKFVYLDMEEYRDLHLTADAFMRTLDRPGLEGIGAGIALQAYMPDSLGVQGDLLAWARRRVAAGGAPITIRLVKGANLEMERVDASLRGWPQAPFKTKPETDACFKRMLQEAMRPENLAAAHIGVASHNLFELAYGMALAEGAGAGDRVQFEMLEGMANHQRRALRDRGVNLLLYAPACRKEDFLNAIGYLIRRLDENTGPENFLRHAFNLQVDSPEWRLLERNFRTSFDVEASPKPRRTQCRPKEDPAPHPEIDWRRLEGEPDTDFSLPIHAAWARGIVETWKPRSDGYATEIPISVAGEEILDGREVKPCADPSRPGVIVGRCRQATAADVERAVECARRDPDGWRALSHDGRSQILARAAAELRRARADLIGAAMAEGGKTVGESDPEASEAVDFVDFYRSTAGEFQRLPGARARGRGVVVVIPPWNFPIAIPCGGVAAALAAGNTVILKPASATSLVAWELCRCFWRAGVPRSALQFAPCAGGGPGAQLAAHPRVDAVILTGGTETALRMLEKRPGLPLFAETGGKNATIVTALADRDLAIKNVVHSAFSHGGQKCSATSLLLLESELYDDPGFRRTLCDAVESMSVGPAWDLATRMGPLIRPPAGDLERGLKTLEAGESWAVMPRRLGDNPCLWSPGVKYGVQDGSYTHLTEFFGPLLSVMRFDRLDEAIAMVNRTGYGLTSGLQSLDEREHEQWKSGIRAGNLYINKPTVGAIVLRQPFGGWGKSCFGPGMKAGGPNYVAQFMSFASEAPETLEPAAADPRLGGVPERFASEVDIRPGDAALIRAAAASYGRWWREEFSAEHDHLRLLGEDNIRRYIPLREIRIRVSPDDTLAETALRIMAARVTGAQAVVSCAPGAAPAWLDLLDVASREWAAGIEFLEESDEALRTDIGASHVARIRYAAPDRVPPAIRRAAAEMPGACVVDEPVTPEGRVELLWYLREQSLSHAYHRYGNLGARAAEARAEPL